MKPLPSTQTIATAAASVAALATATTVVYRLYNNRRHHRELNLNRFSEAFQPDQASLASVLATDVHTRPNTNNNAQHSENQYSVNRNSCQTSNSAPNLIRTRLNSSLQKRISTTTSFQWAVFWDIENVPIPRTTTASQFVKALRKTLAAHRDQTKPDAILRIHAIANIRRTSIRLRHHLRANGVNLTHVESKGRKDVADKALITEICLVTREYATPFGICLISGDGDFSYAVSRLTALGYDTVVIAPTSKSFSSLLAAVPDAVIPLSAVLEICRDPSLEPQTALQDKSHARNTNLQKQNPAQHAKQTLPIHASRRPDRRAVRGRRPDRITLPSSGRDENDCRSSRKSADSSVPDNKPDSQVLPHYFDKSYPDKYGSIRSSPARLLPLKHDQTQVKQAPRRRRVNQSCGKVRENSVQPQDMPTSRAIVESAANSGKEFDAETLKIDICEAQRRNEKVAGSPAKLQTKENIIRKPYQERRDSTPLVKQEKNTKRKGPSDLRSKENGDPKKQRPTLGTSVAAEIRLGTEALWVYNGIRALPFLILLLILVYSFVMKSLVRH